MTLLTPARYSLTFYHDVLNCDYERRKRDKGTFQNAALFLRRITFKLPDRQS